MAESKTPTSPAYRYGVLLGAVQRSMQEFARQVLAGFEQANKPSRAAPSRQPDLESLRVARYRLRIEAERRAGLACVRAQARRARRELGLPEEVGRG